MEAFFEEEYKDRRKQGQEWGKRWSSAWFHLTGTVPDDWAGKQVYAQIKSIALL